MFEDGVPTATRRAVSGLLPRIIALVWAAWSALTALAYVDGPPTQLETVDSMLPIPLWSAWAVAAGLLIVGMAVPPWVNNHVSEPARLARVAGVMITAGLLVLWTVAFVWADAERGWVSGKNYGILLFFALVSAWLVSRESAAGREPE